MHTQAERLQVAAAAAAQADHAAAERHRLSSEQRRLDDTTMEKRLRHVSVTSIFAILCDGEVLQ